MSGGGAGPGAAVRTDIVDAYVFRRESRGVGFLQLRRANDPLAGTWQPVMGHVEPGETSAAACFRELSEEVGLRPPTLRAAWALEQVHPFFIASIDAVVLSPRFAAEAPAGWEPTLNGEHDGHRWVGPGEIAARFMWPGQRAAIAEVLTLLEAAAGGGTEADREMERRLRLAPPFPDERPAGPGGHEPAPGA